MLDVVPGVSGRLEIPISRPYSHILRCWLFQGVYPGYCQITVKRALGSDNLERVSKTQGALFWLWLAHAPAHLYRPPLYLVLS